MGTQTMGSNVPEYDESEGQGQGQGLLYNLTLEEVEQQLGDLGKPLSSMNLDEFLKSFWAPKANQEMSQLASASATASSGLTLSKHLSTKTVDELWHDILEGQRKKNNDNNGSCDPKLDRKSVLEKQHTLGEMTLEDFLVKAGIVTKAKKNPAFVSGVISINPQQAEWMNYEIPPIQQQHVYVPGHHHLQPSLSVPANPFMNSAYLEAQMTASPSALMGTLSDTQTPGRKRVASGDVIERSVERRQRRMIKNRESAARSRARKQAYTHELENKVSRLEEENERLKRQKEVEKVLPCELAPELKYQLRRTTSALF